MCDDWQDPASAARWDGEHLAGNPVRARHVDLLVECLREIDAASVVDLGCGSGLVAERVLDELPGVSLLGVDGSPAMLALARPRLARFGARAGLVEADLALAPLPDVDGPFDGAIAVQSLHHVKEAALARLLTWVRSVLRPGGWLLIVDRVAIPGEAVYPLFRMRKEGVGLGRNPDTWSEYTADLERGRDRPVSVQRYLGLLEAAGFETGCLDATADRAFLVAVARSSDHPLPGESSLPLDGGGSG